MNQNYCNNNINIDHIKDKDYKYNNQNNVDSKDTVLKSTYESNNKKDDNNLNNTKYINSKKYIKSKSQERSRISSYDNINESINFNFNNLKEQSYNSSFLEDDGLNTSTNHIPKYLQNINNNNFLENSEYINESKVLNKSIYDILNTIESSKSIKNNKNILDNNNNKIDNINVELFKKKKKGTLNTNVIILGECYTGKTLFIKSFINKFYSKTKINTIYSNIFEEFQIETDQSEYRKKITLIDTLGFNKDDYLLKDWYKNIKKIIITKFMNYKNLKREYIKDKLKFKYGLIDERITICFYFFKNTTIPYEEITIIKKLNKYVTILPVYINSYDNFNKIEKVIKIKNNILKAVESYNMECFEFDKEETNEKIKNLIYSSKLPLFINYSNKKNCFINTNENGVDFALINFIINTFSLTYFKYQTELKYNQIIEKNKLKKKNKTDYNFGFGVALGISVFGALCAMKKNIFN